MCMSATSSHILSIMEFTFETKIILVAVGLFGLFTATECRVCLSCTGSDCRRQLSGFKSVTCVSATDFCFTIFDNCE